VPVTSWLHEQRLEAASRVVIDSGARRILDLGCGDGDFLFHLIQSVAFDEVVAIDQCQASLARLSRRLSETEVASKANVQLIHGSMLDLPLRYRGFDCALLIETIEHIHPSRLSELEQALFVRVRPACVVMTTPNAEFNSLLGVPANRFRHPDHQFEWDREKFCAWTHGVARRTGYTVTCCDIAGHHPVYGGASQMAVFRVPPVVSGEISG
jgi:SAM-dependent methyltransferase